MADVSRDDYFHMPMNAGGAPDLDVIPAQNVSVADVFADGETAAHEIPADRIRIETPRGGSRPARNVPAAQKIKGAAQMAGGAALVVAGVPMCVLPGPGVASIAGGAALASRGHRNFTGRGATPIEAKLDETAEKLGTVAKEQAAKAARNAAEKAPEVVGNAARTVAQKAPEVAGAAARTAARKAPEVVGKVAVAAAKATPKVAGAAAKAVKAGVSFVANRRKGR